MEYGIWYDDFPLATNQNDVLITLPHIGAPEMSSAQDVQGVNATLQPTQQISPPQQFSSPPNGYMTPAMWQESVASVYEGGLKRGWGQ
jgi:hypothetical protein